MAKELSDEQDECHFLPLAAACIVIAGCAASEHHERTKGDKRMLATLVRRSLGKGCEGSGAEVGWAIIQDARTGEILCAETTGTSCLIGSPSEPWRNCQVELGGLALPFIVASALDAGVVSSNSFVDVSGEKIGGVMLGSALGRDHLTLAEIIKWSTNRGGAQLSLLMGREKTERALHAFGFSVDGSRDEKHNPEAQTAWMGAGYGVSANGLQIASAFSALANGGFLYDARQAKPEEEKAFYGRNVATEATSALVVDMLRGAVANDGTGRLAAVGGLDVFGKTSTIQIRDGSIYTQRFRSMFAGCFPVGDDLYTLLIVFEMPKSQERLTTTLFPRETAKVDAGLVAAPIFADIVHHCQSVL